MWAKGPVPVFHVHGHEELQENWVIYRSFWSQLKDKGCVKHVKTFKLHIMEFMAKPNHEEFTLRKFFTRSGS